MRTLEGLFDGIRRCDACGLHRYRDQAVLPEGNLSSRIMMIAQSPGETENRTGRMFTGPSGRIFDMLLEASGVRREDFYLTNLIKCMLPGARRPSRQERKSCAVWLEEEIRLVQPRILIPLGFHALRHLLIREDHPRPPKNEYHRLFGRYLSTRHFLLYPLRHPTALLFNPEMKEMMLSQYAELRKIVEKYGPESER